MKAFCSILLTAFVLFSLPAAFSSDAAQILSPGQTVVFDLSPGQPAMSFSFRPPVGGRFEAKLTAFGPAPETCLVVNRIRPNGTEITLASGRLTAASPSLALSYDVTPELDHRALVYLDPPSATGLYQITVRGKDDRGSVFLVKDATETHLLSANSSRMLADFPVAGTATFLWSPRGDQLLYGDYCYRLADTFSGATIGQVTPSGEGVFFAFTMDGDRLLMADAAGKTVSVISTQDFAMVGVYSGDSFQIGPQSRRMAVSGAQTAFIVDPLSGGILRQWSSVSTSAARVSPDGGAVAFWDLEGATPVRTRLFEMESGEPLGATHEFESIESVTFSPDGSRVAWTGKPQGSASYQLMLCSATDGASIAEISSQVPLAAEFDFFSRRLLVTPAGEVPSGKIGAVSLLDARTGELLQAFLSFRSVSLIRFDPFSRTLLVGGIALEDFEEVPNLKYLDASSGAQIQQFNPDEIQRAAYSPSGDRFFILQLSSIEGQTLEEVMLLDALDGTRITGDVDKDWRVVDWTRVRFSPDGERLVSQNEGISFGGLLLRSIVRRTSDGNILPLSTQEEHSVFGQLIQAQGFSPDSTRYYYIGLGAAPRVLRLIDLVGGQRVRSDVLFQAIEDPIFSPDGSRLLYIGLRTGETQPRFESLCLADGSIHRGDSLRYTSASSLAYSGDGRRVLFSFTTPGGSNLAFLLDAGSLEITQAFDASFGAEFDYTVYPHFADFDFNQDGRIDGWDLFFLQRRLDPVYSGVLHEFVGAARIQ